MAESILETSWIEDGIADSEKDAIQEIVDMAAFHDGITKSVLALDWYEDGVSETELRAIRYLDAIAGDDEPAAEIVASLAWFVDGVSESDVYAMRNILLISQDDGASARRIVAMPFISTLEPADIAAIRSLSSMAYFQSRGFEYVMARDSLSDGITDAQSPIVAMLYGVYKINPGLMDTLLDPNLTTIERRMISLPLTGSVDLVIVRTRPGAARSMDLLEYAARTSEELMGEPLPTNFVGLLFEDAVSGGFAGTNFGTHITILPKYDVDDDSREANFAPHSIAHEVAHYYWSGNADWVDEGAADFMASAIENRRIGESIGVTNDPCPYANSIDELEEIAPERGSVEFRCNYSLGERLFVDMRHALGDESVWAALRSLYLASEIDNDPDDGRRGARVGVEHVREAFQINKESNGNGAATVLARWYDGGVEHDLSRLDPSAYDPSLPNINGRIDQAYITLNPDGTPVSMFSTSDVAGYVWLNLEYSYNVGGAPRETTLEIVEFYEDGFEFKRRRYTISAQSAYIGGTSWYSIGANPPAPGRYWVYVYDGARKVAEVQYEVTP